MRNSYWIVTFLLVLECVVLLIEPAECLLSFIPVSVHTALNILTLLVKIKSIIFKILLGLKLMGKVVRILEALISIHITSAYEFIIIILILLVQYEGVEGFIVRRRRRSISSEGDAFVDDYTNSNSYLDWKMESLPESQRTELLLAWKGLERLLGHNMLFQENVCINAANKFSRRPVAIWDGTYMRESDMFQYASSNTNNIDPVIQEQRSQSRWYCTENIILQCLG